MKKIKDVWFYFPVIVLSIFLIYQLIKIGLTIPYWPLHNFSDNTSYLSQLHFLREYGFLASVPDWYGGFINLKFYSPLWYFVNLPFYILTDHVTLTAFITTVLFLAVLLAVFLYIGKYSNMSRIKSVFLYLTFLLAPSYYFSLFKMGRFPVLLAYVFLFISFLFLVKYKDKKLDWYFILLSIPYAGILLSHPSEFLLFSLLLLGLFLQRANKERLITIAVGAVTILLSSFWLIPFLDNKDTVISQHTEIFPAIFQQGLNIISIGGIVVGLFLISFYLFWKSKDFSRKILLFYSPAILYSLLYISDIYAHLPIVQNIYTITTNSFYVFLAGYLFLNTDFNLYPFKKVILVLIQIVPITFILYAQVLYPTNFIHSEEDSKTIELLDKMDDNYLILASTLSTQYGSYLTIHNGLTTPDGFFQEGANTEYYLNIQSKRNLLMESNDCNLIKSTISEIDINYIFARGNFCSAPFTKCGFERIPPYISSACLFKLDEVN